MANNEGIITPKKISLLTDTSRVSLLDRDNFEASPSQQTEGMSSPKKKVTPTLADTGSPSVSINPTSPKNPANIVQSPTSMSPTGTHQPMAGIPRSHVLRFPFRVGITWKKGEKLEAMDFSRTWYPSKIVEIEAATKQVLIHFEGWNQRYDEWVPMDSEKLRPCTRHSERKERGIKKRRIHPHPIYRAGEQVLAKWTDCKRYPAKISRQMEDGAYEVIFYDGVSRMIQPMNIRPMPEEMKATKLPFKTPPQIRAKIPFKHIKVSLPEVVRKRNEQRLASGAGKIFGKKKKFPTMSRTPTSTSSTADQEKEASDSVSVINTSPLKMKKTKRKSATIECEGTITTLSEKEALQLFSSKGAQGTTASTVVSSPVQPSTPPLTTTVHTKKTVTVTTMGTGENEPTEIVTPVPAETDKVDTIAQPVVLPEKVRKVPGPKKRKKRSHTDPYLPKRKIPKSKSGVGSSKPRVLGKRPQSLVSGERAKSLDVTAATATSLPVTPLLPVQAFIPAKAFIVEEDHNPYKCPHDGCNKDFRKENLLSYHIKYYHTDLEPSASTPPSTTSSAVEASASVVSSPVLPQGLQSPHAIPSSRKRRKKTNSVCSTDSDVSISSKGKSSTKRQRHDSEISVTTMSPDLAGRDVWADMKPQIPLEAAAEEALAADTDEDMESDVVNCVCGQRETNGLMIQCDVCMCWQHFACVDNKNTGVPPNHYVCNVCENTPGVRDSCRYLYDLGWERRGELPAFPFAGQTPAGEHRKSLACECNELTSVLQGMKSALHSTRRQIKISKEEEDPEFQLWQTDWDNWTKPEEDITLTPRSVDPEPSPTPSNFLFPSVPNSNLTVPATANTSGLVATSSPCTSVSSLHSSLSSSSLTHVASNMSGQSFSTLTSHLNGSSSSKTITTGTIEVTTTLSVSPEAQATGSTTPAVTPPSGDFLAESLSPSISSNQSTVPRTPSIERSSFRPSIQGQAENLIKDLFPGPSGDAFKSHSQSSHTQDISRKVVDQKDLNTLTAKSDTEDLKDPCSDLDSGKHSEYSLQSHTPGTGQKSVTEFSSSSPVQKDSDQNNAAQESAQGSNSSLRWDQEKSSDVLNGKENDDNQKTNDGVSQSSGTSKDGVLGALSGEGQRGENSTLSPKPMTSLYINVNGTQGSTGDFNDNDDNQDNDTDTAEESVDPYKNCEHNLLVHVTRVHSDIEKQLEALEQQIIELENSEHSNPTVQLSEDNILNDVPAVKKSLSKLARSLYKVQRLSVHH